MITILGIYLFIVIGFFAKKIFKEIDGKSLVLLSIYFLQPFLALWGILLVKIDTNLILSPFLYLIAIFISLFFTYLTTFIFKDKKEKIIVALTPLIGNTGNLGIPLCYGVFGEVGASIATLINLANVFFIYSFGVFFFARGEYNFKESVKKIVKIPILWFGILGIILNRLDIKFNEIMHILQMGAYASMVIQLLIFGIYLAEVKIKEIDKKLAFIVSFNKFILLPFITFLVMKFFNIPFLYKKVILLEVSTPLAVTNVNLSALFNTYPNKTAFLIIITSILFLGIFAILKGFGWI